MNKRVGVIGAGNVGTSLAIILQEKGYVISGVCCSTEESSRRVAKRLSVNWNIEPHHISSNSDIVFITTPDRIIQSVCKQITDNSGFRSGQIVIHTSGAHSSHILNDARSKGAYVLSMHPLQTFPGVDVGVQNVPGSYFTVEGDEQALSTGMEIVNALGGKALSIPTSMKPLYHASACTVCNYFTALFDLGLKMMEKVGVPRSDALPALLPLVEGTLANIKKVGVPQALTGPIDRGDSETVKGHLIKMNEIMPEVAELYSKLGEYTAGVAVSKGTLNEDGLDRVLKALR